MERGSLTITTGVWKTRRKTFCYVTNEKGEVLFQHRRLWPCVRWMDQMEIEAYIIRPDLEEDDGGAFIMVDRRRDRKWQR